MSTRILTVFAQANGLGHVLRLTAAEPKAGGIAIACSGVNATLSFNVAMNRAFSAVWNTLGKPGYLPDVECSFSSLGGAQGLPTLDGGSLYGAFSLVLTQYFAIYLDGKNRQLRHPLRGYLEAIRSVDLSTVAVSAEGEPSTGDFRAVGGIDQKLVSLAGLGNQVSCCVLAPGQTVPSIVTHSRDEKTIANIVPEDYLRSKNSQIPIIYAQDPLDAFGQIFERRAKALAGRIA